MKSGIPQTKDVSATDNQEDLDEKELEASPPQSPESDNRLAVIPHVNIEENIKASLSEMFTFGFTFYAVTWAPRSRALSLVFAHRPWWSDIVPGIKLGAIPILNYNHHEILPEECEKEHRPLGLIVSCNKDFELKGHGLIFLQPVPKACWAHLEIPQIHLKMEDFGGDVPLQEIFDELGKIHQTVTEGKTAYIHCKAGRGRSVLVTICYMIYYHNMTPSQATEFVRERRPEISLSRKQFAIIDSFCEKFRPDLFTSLDADSGALVLHNGNNRPDSWWDLAAKWVVWIIKGDSIREHIETLKLSLSQGHIQQLIVHLNERQSKTLLRGIKDERQSWTGYVNYYPIYNAGRVIAEESEDEEKVQELTDALEEKLKLK